MSEIYGDINNPPKFHKNWDDSHCTECCLRGVIDYFEPNNDMTWEDIDRLSNKKPDKWNWPQFGIKSMLDCGYQIKRISSSKTEDIIENGAREYLIKIQGLETAKISIKNSPPLNEIESVCHDLLKYESQEQIVRVPEPKDIRNLLNQGYLVHSMVNQRALNAKEGYAGHAVLIYAMDNEYIYFHDSGLPAVESRKEKISFFVQCAKNPKDTNWYLIGYKKINSL